MAACVNQSVEKFHGRTVVVGHSHGNSIAIQTQRIKQHGSITNEPFGTTKPHNCQEAENLS